MRENGKKSHPPCHTEHIQVLNTLTDSLKDELKRGLNLLDNCVNQLAQAKWILINVERTIEDSYTDCPACDKDTRNASSTSRAVSPPTPVVKETNKKTGGLGRSKKVSDSPPPASTPKTTKAPPAIKEPKSARKSKAKEKEPVTTPKVRGRGSGSTALATASAIAHTGLDADEFQDKVVKEEPESPSPQKKKPGPMSKTRVISKEPLDYKCDGASICVDLDDIRGALGGRSSFKGAQLRKVLEIIGSDLKLESEKPSKTDKISEKPSKKDASKAEPKKSKLNNDADSSEDEDLETKKKKLEDKQSSLKTLSTLKAASASSPSLTSELSKPGVKSILQASFLNFARKKNLLGKPTNKLDEASSKGEEQKSEPSKTVDTDTEDDKSKKVEPKSVKSDASDEDESLEKKKKSKAKWKDSNDEESDEEYSSRPKRKPGPKRRKSKQHSSNDDSDPEFNASPPAKKRTSTAGPKSRTKPVQDSKFKTPETIESDSSSGSNSSGNDGRKKKAKRRESSRESPRKSPARRNSNESKSSSRKGMNREDSPASKTSTRKVKDSDDEGSVKSSVKSFSSVPPPPPKPKMNRPGPKSAKMRLAQKKQEDDDSKMDVDDDTGNVKNDTIQNKMFSDSDSEDSEILKIKKKFPLDLQDAVRSPSPSPQPKDLFGKLLSAYKPDSDSTEPSSKLHKFKQGAKQIQSKVYEVSGGMQKKLGGKGWELAPYTGSISASDDVFTPGKYYVVGQGSKEKLVMFDESSELQELVFTDSDIEELLE